MKKISIYPYSRELSPLVDYISLCGAYEISYLVATKKSGLVEHDSRFAEHADGVYTVTGDLETAITGCDVFALFQKDSRSDDYDFISLAKKALSNGKEVICSFFADEHTRQELDDFAKSHSASIHFLYESFMEDNEYTDSQYIFNGIYVPQAKVVFVSGLIKDLDQQRICLGLAAQAKSRGYHATVLGCSAWFSFFGFHNIGTILDDTVPDGIDAIRTLNSLIRKIDTTEKPDMIIIEIPGEIMKFNDMVCGDFGTSLFKVSQAVKADESICCLPFGEYTDSFLSSISEYTDKKFDCAIHHFHLSNRVFLFNESIEMQKSITFASGLKRALTQTADMRQILHHSVFNAFDSQMSKTVYDTIIDRFEKL